MTLPGERGPPGGGGGPCGTSSHELSVARRSDLGTPPAPPSPLAAAGARLFGRGEAGAAAAERPPRQLSTAERPLRGGGGAGGGNASSPEKHSGSDDIVQACKIAKSLQLPINQMRQAYNLFKEFADYGASGSIVEARLDKAQFCKVIRKMTQQKSEGGIPSHVADGAFERADQDGGGDLDFSEFATWLVHHSFDEDISLDEDELKLRNLARKYDISIREVEEYKRTFERMDEDKSGLIEKEEFENLILACGKVPKHVGVNETRLNRLWSDADNNGNGSIDFEEFLVFYRMTFDQQAGASGLETYYRGFRNVSMR